MCVCVCVCVYFFFWGGEGVCAFQILYFIKKLIKNSWGKYKRKS